MAKSWTQAEVLAIWPCVVPRCHDTIHPGSLLCPGHLPGLPMAPQAKLDIGGKILTYNATKKVV